MAPMAVGMGLLPMPVPPQLGAALPQLPVVAIPVMAGFPPMGLPAGGHGYGGVLGQGPGGPALGNAAGQGYGGGGYGGGGGVQGGHGAPPGRGYGGGGGGGPGPGHGYGQQPHQQNGPAPQGYGAGGRGPLPPPQQPSQPQQGQGYGDVSRQPNGQVRRYEYHYGRPGGPGPGDPGRGGGGGGAGGGGRGGAGGDVGRPRRHFSEAPAHAQGPGGRGGGDVGRAHGYGRQDSREGPGPGAVDRGRGEAAPPLWDRGRDRERERTPDPDERRYAPAQHTAAGVGAGMGPAAAKRRDAWEAGGRAGGAGPGPGPPRVPPGLGPDQGMVAGRSAHHPAGPHGAAGAPTAAAAAPAAAAGRAAAPAAATPAEAAAAAVADPDYVSRQGHVYTVLGRNIKRIVAQLTPSAAEAEAREGVLREVVAAAAAAFPEARGRLRVEPFGSYVCGLGTPSSDIDVVLVGLAEPSPALGFYGRDERPRVARLLDRITPQLRCRLRLSKLLAIRHARIPILKLTTQAGVSVDVSVAGDGGPRAAAFIRQQAAAYPALRPLVLVLKSYMRAEGLAEVASGGLSSYGLTYMLLAHLQEEAKRGSDLGDLGGLLHSALRRYGRCFDVNTMAVSVRDGGLVPKASLGFGHVDHGDRIVTIDPLTGRNCTEGTWRSREVLDALGRADAYLSGWLQVPAAGVAADADILGPLVADVEAAEGQEGEGQQHGRGGGLGGGGGGGRGGREEGGGEEADVPYIHTTGPGAGNGNGTATGGPGQALGKRGRA
ncbi:hypothetical protein HXX76_011542 [Chlamydomonas incerta]|uniref:Poly(A) RNA polymerase mitochondrial-like central palm domain-containing protein n=1 Tax=Chlamydomonas incerta TaxID=51695 RepID=A0A835SJP4_CHLIN|nr:hypothetical protein HXX76_011542 [Chlamydomonas incerta]|eukprot:KAG2428422.1 hypothetical protein HXX76_011542 [Chlamydomonas incerta]